MAGAADSPINRIAGEVLVLNMDRSPDRLAAIDTELTRHGVRFTRLAAVEGAALTSEQVGALATPACAAMCTPAMIGSFLSHMKAWAHILDRGLDSALIFEDDIGLADGYEEPLVSAYADLPPDYDILYISCFTCTEPTALDRLFQGSMGKGFARPERLGEHLVRPVSTLGCHAYLMSAKGARAALAALPLADFMTDLALTRKSGGADGLQVYAVTPDIVFQTGAQSTIGAGGKPPVMLNTVAAQFPYSTSGRDGRTWSWVMSYPLCKLGHATLVLDGWVLLGLAVALLAPRAFLWLFLVELVVAAASGTSLQSAFFLVPGLLLLLSAVRTWAAPR